MVVVDNCSRDKQNPDTFGRHFEGELDILQFLEALIKQMVPKHFTDETAGGAINEIDSVRHLHTLKASFEFKLSQAGEQAALGSLKPADGDLCLFFEQGSSDLFNPTGLSPTIGVQEQGIFSLCRLKASISCSGGTFLVLTNQQDTVGLRRFPAAVPRPVVDHDDLQPRRCVCLLPERLETGAQQPTRVMIRDDDRDQAGVIFHLCHANTATLMAWPRGEQGTTLNWISVGPFQQRSRYRFCRASLPMPGA